jgi:CheY-like chemotaxis protein
VAGTVSLGANASDASTAVQQVVFERSPAGTSTWTTIGTDSSAPYGASWNTGGVTDGFYDVRAVATDILGHTHADVVANRRVDNTAPDTSIDNGPADPSNDATPTFDFSSSEAGSTFECRTDGGSWSPCTSPDTTSALGEGTVATLALPVAAAARGSASLPSAPQLRGTRNGLSLNVLYAEDNEVNAELLRQIVTLRPSVSLRVAENGTVALQMARSDPPDLMLVDMNLGDMTGIELASALQENPRTADLRLVALSADALPEQISATLAAGISVSVSTLTKVFGCAGTAIIGRARGLAGAPSEANSERTRASTSCALKSPTAITAMSSGRYQSR